MERTVFISGSFEKYYDGMLKKIKEFEDSGFTVLSPKSLIIAPSNVNATLLLRNKDPKNVKFIQGLVAESTKMQISTAIERSDVFYLYNPGGDTNTRSALELGIALGYDKLVFAEETMKNETLSEFCPKATMSQILNQMHALKKRATSPTY